MTITPDEIVFWQWGAIKISATLVLTWAVMGLIVLGAILATRGLTPDGPLTRWQHVMEIVVGAIRDQIRDVTRESGAAFMPFIGTLFLFVAVSNTLSFVPFYLPPTGSLNTTAALAICVFFAVPYWGIKRRGVADYLRQYTQPTIIMLPMNIIGDFSRTLALAVRLFGNMLSGGMIAAILLILAPLFVPVLMQVLGLLVGLIQAYIFAVLAMMFIAAAIRSDDPKNFAKGDRP